MPKQPDDDRTALPIDPEMSANKQSRESLRLADENHLPVVVRWPLDMGNPDHVARHLAEFGGRGLPTTDPEGMFYVVYVISEGGDRVAFTLAEGEVQVAMAVLAARQGGKPLASKFAYREDLFPR